MGEAKRRKETDPYFGRIPKERPMRGIVISTPLSLNTENNSVAIRSSDIDPIELRSALLFWDKLVWPASRLISFGSSVDLSFLEETGVLRRPAYSFSGEAATILLKTQIQAFRDMEQENPGCWALAQGERSLQIVGHAVPSTRSMLVTLSQAVPVPSADVPFAEILEFKERRLPELYKFRAEIERLYLEVAKSADPALTTNRAIERIQGACLDLIKANKEWRYRSVLSDFDFSIAPAQWATAGAAFFTAQSQGLDAVSALFGSTVAAGITYTPKLIRRFVERRQSPYRYAMLAHKELVF